MDSDQLHDMHALGLFPCAAQLFAYGQTGAGKTYTMGTAQGRADILAKEPRGAVPRVLQHIFAHMKRAATTHTVTLSCAYYEVRGWFSAWAARAKALLALTLPCPRVSLLFAYQ